MSLREEFVRLATRSGANRRELCRRLGIGPDTGYRLLERLDPERLPAVEYPAGDHVRKVQDRGPLECRGRRLHGPRGLRGPSVALRPLDEDGRWAIYFTTERIGAVDLRVSS